MIYTDRPGRFRHAGQALNIDGSEGGKTRRSGRPSGQPSDESRRWEGRSADRGWPDATAPTRLAAALRLSGDLTAAARAPQPALRRCRAVGDTGLALGHVLHEAGALPATGGHAAAATCLARA